MQAVGDVSTSDVDLARASEAIIVGFNVKVSTAVQAYADHENVEIRMYRVIYELVDDMRKAMEGLLKPAEVKITQKHFIHSIYGLGSSSVVSLSRVELYYFTVQLTRIE